MSSTGVRYQVSGNIMSSTGVRYQVSGARCQVCQLPESDIKCQVSWELNTELQCHMSSNHPVMQHGTEEQYS